MHWFFFTLLVLMQSAAGQWTFQANPTTARLNRASFVDSLKGWAVGVFHRQDSSTVIKTTNGGGTWDASLFPAYTLYDIAFVDSQNGWVVGMTTSGKRLILRSSDGGTSWDVVDSNLVGAYNSVQFLNGQHGWIGGWCDTAGIVLRTIDGGSTWQTTVETSFAVVDMSFPDSKHGWIVSINGKLFFSSDGGASWHFSYQVLESPLRSGAAQMRRVFFTDSLNGCAVGGISAVETKAWTHDGGLSWQVTNITPGSGMRGLWFADKNNGWCVGGIGAGLKIQKTTDGGVTWSDQAVPPDFGAVANPFREVIFTSHTQGWVFAEGGYIFHTTNGGEVPTSTIIVPLAPIPAEFDLRQNYPNPFNPSTTITFELPQTTMAKLQIWDLMGRHVETLLSKELPAGTHSVEWRPWSTPSGVYFVRLKTRDAVLTRKVVLLR